MKSKLVLFSAIALLAAGEAFAADPAMQGQGQQAGSMTGTCTMSALDTNSDGSISQDEYVQAQRQSFSKFDQDKNSKLDRTEAQTLISKNCAMMSESYQRGRMGDETGSSAAQMGKDQMPGATGGDTDQE